MTRASLLNQKLPLFSNLLVFLGSANQGSFSYPSRICFSKSGKTGGGGGNCTSCSPADTGISGLESLSLVGGVFLLVTVEHGAALATALALMLLAQNSGC